MTNTYGAIDSRAADGIAAATTSTGAGGVDGGSKSSKSAKNTHESLNNAGLGGGMEDAAAIVVDAAVENKIYDEDTLALPSLSVEDKTTGSTIDGGLPIENKIYDEDTLALPLGINRDDNDGEEKVVSTMDEEVELKAIDKWNFYMDHVPEDDPEQEPRGQEDGQVDGGLKATDKFSFYTEHNKKDDGGAGGIATRGGDDEEEDDGDGRGGSNDEGIQAAGDAAIVLKSIDDTQFYEDYVPDEGVGLNSEDEGDGEEKNEYDLQEPEVEYDETEYESDISLRTVDMDPASVATPTVSPSTSSPTMKPTNRPVVPPPPLPTNAPVVPPPLTNNDPTAAAVVLPRHSCFEENGVEVCVAYHADLTCEMKVDGMTCDCCRYNSAVGFISTFDCTNIGEGWGQMGLCEPGPMPVQEDKKKKNKDETIEEDALSMILSLEYGDDETDIAADAISLAWSTAGTEAEVSTDSIASIAMRQRRGRRRAQAVRRKTAVTKKRREAMMK